MHVVILTLHLAGDAHLVDCTAARAGLWVCLLAVLKQEKNGAAWSAPVLCPAALDTALAKMAIAAARMSASVHTPRLAQG